MDAIAEAANKLAEISEIKNGNKAKLINNPQDYYNHSIIELYNELKPEDKFDIATQERIGKQLLKERLKTLEQKQQAGKQQAESKESKPNLKVA